MIYLYSGTPGSGKSLDLARVLYVNKKSTFIINFPCSLVNEKDRDIFYISDWESTLPQDLTDFSEKYFKTHRFKEGAITIIIDECQLYYNTREWSKTNRMGWLKFFTNHRHFGFDIILCCQNSMMIDKQIRNLIEIEVVHRKINNMGLGGLFIRCLMLSPTLFIKVHFYFPLKLKESASYFRYKKKYAEIYDSFDKSFFEQAKTNNTRKELGLEENEEILEESKQDVEN